MLCKYWLFHWKRIPLQGMNTVKNSCQICERCLFQNFTTSFNELLNTFIIPPNHDSNNNYKEETFIRAWIILHSSEVILFTVGLNVLGEGSRAIVTGTDPSSY
jgi:hypothetical protein